MTSIAPSADDLKGSSGPDFLAPPRAIAYTDTGQIPNALTEAFIQKVFGTLGFSGIGSINSGWGVVQWSAATPTSRTSTLTHGLPVAAGSDPKFAIVATPWDGIKSGTFNYTPIIKVSNITATTFDVIGATVDATNPGGVGEFGVIWIAMSIGAFSGPIP